MEIVRDVPALRAVTQGWRAAGHSIGVVPTMGALHEGHLSLVRQAKAECDRVIVTLFVNPKQFERPDDLEHYPRDEAGDVAQLEPEGADLLYAPTPEAMYPEGFSTAVSVSGVSEGLCGAARPGHFGGVATVVAKLLLQTLPDRAYFGQKDYQQLQIIRRLTADLDIPVAIIGGETVREADGLALSSRNRLLTPEQRRIAPVLNRAMRGAAVRLRSGDTAEQACRQAGDAVLAAGFDRVDYIELRAADGLAPMAALDGRPARLLAAAWLDRVRLIDSIDV